MTPLTEDQESEADEKPSRWPSLSFHRFRGSRVDSHIEERHRGSSAQSKVGAPR